MKTLYVSDLDGTLLNTIYDIGDCLNHDNAREISKVFDDSRFSRLLVYDEDIDDMIKEYTDIFIQLVNNSLEEDSIYVTFITKISNIQPANQTD